VPGFYFAINNQPIFCGGANWIPAELSLTTR
jgi:beta-galactosidase/beta-glucuronidase